MKKLGALILVFVTVSALSACNQRVPVQNVVSAPLGATADVTMEQVTTMMEQVFLRRNWEILKQNPGEVTAMLSVSGGKHKVAAKIVYDTESFSITYVDSDNMNYRAAGASGQIHPKYNIWVSQLRQDIEIAVAEL